MKFSVAISAALSTFTLTGVMGDLGCDFADVLRFRLLQKEVGKSSSITFSIFGHFLVTFSVTFLPDSFCQTPFLGQGEQFQVAAI